MTQEFDEVQSCYDCDNFERRETEFGIKLFCKELKNDCVFRIVTNPWAEDPCPDFSVTPCL